MEKYITEFIGTFFLVLVIALTGMPLAIGAALMIMVFAGGHISGAHYNPAVTLAVLIRGKISGSEALFYMITQFFAAVIAALLAQWFLNTDLSPMNLSDKSWKALAGELLGTFALAYVVLNVAIAKGNAGNSFYGLAIGFTVFVMATAFGGFSGGAFNPAVALAIAVLKVISWSDIWIYLVGCFGGAAIAAMVFNFINKEDKPVPPIQQS